MDQEGFIKWAFIFSFYYLKRATKLKLNYRETIEEIVSMGGDTDTNACIAGGMVGAILGVRNLDYKMVRTLF